LDSHEGEPIPLVLQERRVRPLCCIQVVLESLLGRIFVLLGDEVKTPPRQQLMKHPAGVLWVIVEDMPS
jgi:hypothetical protein